MGNRVSRPQTPQEILEIDGSATLQETKKAYCRLSYKHKNDPDMLLVLNDAYASCQTHIPFETYTPALFDTQFSRYAPDFFARLERAYNLHPRNSFLDGDFTTFYRYWATFRHEDQTVECRVRSIIRMIKARDPRFIRPAAAVVPEKQKAQPLPSAPRIKTWKLQCEACGRGFNSENTLKDHLRSRQHRERAGVDAVAEETLAPADKKRKPARSAPADRAPEKVEEKRGGTAVEGRKEHEAFRTCFHCKQVMESRGQLIMHIREKHQ